MKIMQIPLFKTFLNEIDSDSVCDIVFQKSMLFGFDTYQQTIGNIAPKTCNL